MSTPTHAIALWETVCWYKGHLEIKYNLWRHSILFVMLSCSLAVPIVDMNSGKHSTVFIIWEGCIFDVEK